jgi:hypothetical protein
MAVWAEQTGRDTKEMGYQQRGRALKNTTNMAKRSEPDGNVNG